MNALKIAVEEVWGLFVEDGTLAVGILVWLAIAAFVFPLMPEFASLRAPALFGGLAVVLVDNVWRSAKRHFRDSKR